jgi:gas vesicle protein
MQERDNTSSALWFVAGVAIGSTIALLYAPTSGRDTRGKIVSKARYGKEKLEAQGREMMDKGRELYDRGREIADEAADLFDRGRKVMQG